VDGRSLEWSISSPAPEYNFLQIPLVRSYDAFWNEKMAGNKEMPASEPIGPIHMPSPSILPFIMSVGLFISGFGFMFARHDFPAEFLNFLFGNHIIAVLGLIIFFTCMVIRSLVDDHGFHIEPEELGHKGVKA
jgi:cytochrome c oxidase subunit 1